MTATHTETPKFVQRPRLARSSPARALSAIAVLFAAYARLGGAEEETKWRVITEDELSTKIDNGGEGEIWLSVLGEVYDVTVGRAYYGGDSGYAIFAGRDASAAYATGDFSAEGVKKDVAELNARELVGVKDWKNFYADHEEYKKVGVLCCDFYDEDGNPTEKLENILAITDDERQVKGQDL